jgi:Multiubiquitin
MNDDVNPAAPPHDHGIPVQIDRRPYKAPHSPMTGAELKALAGITGDYDLYFETPGPQDDLRLKDGEPFAFKPGAKFYSVPRNINPGS